MKRNISINQFQYSLFYHYNNFQFPKVFLFIPLVNLYFFHVITSAWFFNLQDPNLYQLVRKRFLFFTKVVALAHIFVLVAAMLFIDYNFIKGIISFSILTLFYLYFIFVIPFHIIWEKNKIWNICLKYSNEKFNPIDLPILDYSIQFINNMTENLFKINNIPSWFFKEYQDKLPSYDYTKPLNEAYNPTLGRGDALNTFFGIRNASIIFSSSIYYGLVNIVSVLLQVDYKIPKLKQSFIVAFSSALISFCFWIFSFFILTFVLFQQEKFQWLLSVAPYIYLIFFILLSTMFVIKIQTSKKVRSKLMSVLKENNNL